MYLDQNLECLGRRLEAARNSLQLARTPWAQRHWDETVRYLQRKWNLMLSESQPKLWEPYTINRNWFYVDNMDPDITWLHNQMMAVINFMRSQEFVVDLEQIHSMQQALKPKGENYESA